MAGPIRIAILANASQANREINQTSSTAQRLGDRMSKLRGPALAAVGGIALLGKASAEAASKAQQSLGGTQAIFGKFADDIIKTSDRAAKKYGLSANEYRESANLIGALLKNQGVAMDKLGPATDQLVARGADLASMFGGTTSEAVEALSAAFKGEFDSLDKYGVSLSAAKIQAELAAKGQDKLTGSALDAAKQQATTRLIMKQSADAAGNFAKESTTAAGSQQIAAAQFENTKAKLGTVLLPILAKGSAALGKFATFASENSKTVQILAGVIVGLAAVVLAASVAQKVHTAALVIYKGVQAAITAATKAWAIAQAALNVVMSLNPIGLVVIAIAALVAGIVIAYKNSETFRRIVDKAWAAIRTATVKVFDAVRAKIAAVIGFVKTLFLNFTGPGLIIKHWARIRTATATAFNWVRDKVKQILGAIKTAFLNFTGPGLIIKHWNTIRTRTREIFEGVRTTVRDKIDAVLSLVRRIRGKVIGIFSGAGTWLFSAGKRIIQGLINGVDSLIDSFTGRLKSLTDKIPDLKGPASRDRMLLYKNGQLIMEGLIRGWDSRVPTVEKSLRKITGDIGRFDASLTSEPLRIDHAVFAGKGASQTEPTVVEIRSSGSKVDDLLIELLRPAIRTRGGNVQLVLGRGSS